MIRISTKAHGIADLVYGAAFLAAPFLLKVMGNGKKNGSKGIENTLLPALGAGILAQGLVSDHELGAVKALKMPAHLTMDLGLSAFMIAAPWVLNMDKRTRIPMAVLGATGLGLALFTKTRPGYESDDEAGDHETTDNLVETMEARI